VFAANAEEVFLLVSTAPLHIYVSHFFDQTLSDAATGDAGFRAAAPLLRGSPPGRDSATTAAAAFSAVASSDRAASAFERCLQTQVAARADNPTALCHAHPLQPSPHFPVPPLPVPPHRPTKQHPRARPQLRANAGWQTLGLPFRRLPVLRVTLLDLKNLSASPMAGLQRLAEVP
jgi:hypothetical protein